MLFCERNILKTNVNIDYITTLLSMCQWQTLAKIHYVHPQNFIIKLCIIHKNVYNSDNKNGFRELI